MNKFWTNTPIIKSDLLNTKISLQVIFAIYFVLIKTYMTDISAMAFPTIKIKLTMVSAARCLELRRENSI